MVEVSMLVWRAFRDSDKKVKYAFWISASVNSNITFVLIFTCSLVVVGSYYCDEKSTVSLPGDIVISLGSVFDARYPVVSRFFAPVIRNQGILPLLIPRSWAAAGDSAMRQCEMCSVPAKESIFIFSVPLDTARLSGL